MLTGFVIVPNLPGLIATAKQSFEEAFNAADRSARRTRPSPASSVMNNCVVGSPFTVLASPIVELVNLHVRTADALRLQATLSALGIRERVKHTDYCLCHFSFSQFELDGSKDFVKHQPALGIILPLAVGSLASLDDEFFRVRQHAPDHVFFNLAVLTCTSSFKVNCMRTTGTYSVDWNDERVALSSRFFALLDRPIDRYALNIDLPSAQAHRDRLHLTMDVSRTRTAPVSTVATPTAISSLTADTRTASYESGAGVTPGKTLSHALAAPWHCRN